MLLRENQPYVHSRACVCFLSRIPSQVQVVMAGGKNGFLDELTGDFVKFLRGDTSIAALIGGNSTDARIFPEAARQGAPLPHIVYTQSAGNREKILSGVEGCIDMTVHVYCYADTQPGSRALAAAVANRMLTHESGPVGDGTILHIANGGEADSGHDADKASGDRKKFWTRLVLRMVVE